MQCALKAGHLWIVEMLLAAEAKPDLMVEVIALHVYAHYTVLVFSNIRLVTKARCLYPCLFLTRIRVDGH